MNVMSYPIDFKTKTKHIYILNKSSIIKKGTIKYLIMDFGFLSIIKLHINVHMVIVVFIYDDK
jgi:hypothetical protein